MTDPRFPIDPENLPAALTHPATDDDIDEPSAREIAWTATYGPGTPDDALTILASARARRLLAHEWDQQCPSPQLLDAAVAPTDADPDTELHAHAVHTLLTLHTRTCLTCADRLHALRDALDTLNQDIDQVDHIIHTWAFTLTPANTPTRGDDQTNPTPLGDAPLRQVLDDPDLYQTLTGRPRTETDRWPTLTLTPTTPPDQATTRLHARLIIPAGIQPALTITVIAHLPTGALPIPLTPTSDGITLTGQATAPTWPPTHTLTIQIQATPT